MIRVFVGFDPREAAAYHVFCQSVLKVTTTPVTFTALHEPMLNFDGQRDGTNAFIYSRYLVPWLCGFEGWALFADGDMVALEDLAHLWALRDAQYAVQVVQHDYVPTARKYVGSPMESDNPAYPRKNWSSVVLWNCGHPSNALLSRQFVTEAGGKFLHRFEWLRDAEIGALPAKWNRLIGEQGGDVSLAHYTLGIPGFRHYAGCETAGAWHAALLEALNVCGENPVEVVRRAHDVHRTAGTGS